MKRPHLDRSELKRLASRLTADRQAWLCALVSLALLLPGAGWGIPQATSPVTIRGWDVDGIGGIGVLAELHNLLVGGKEDWYVAYPLLHYLVLAVVYAPYMAYLLATRGLHSPGPEYPYGFEDPVSSIATMALLGRVVSLAMASAAVTGTFVMVRRAFGVLAAGTAAGLLLLCAPLLFYARTGNLDVPVLFWTVLTFLTIQSAWTDGLTVRRAALCGALASLAVATKDQAYGLLAPALVALLVHAWRVDGRRAMRPGLWLVGSGILTFLVAGGLVIRPDRFLRHVRYITSFEQTFANVRVPNDLTVIRPGTLAGTLELAGDFLKALGAATGWPAVAIAVIGLLVGWRQGGLVRWLALSVAGFFVLVVLPIHHMQYRYVLGPQLLVAVGVGAVLHGLSTRRMAQRVVAGIALVGALPGAAELTHAQLLDARGAASSWMHVHMAPGDTLGFFGRPHQLPHVPPGVVVLSLTDAGEPAENLARWRPRWLVVAPDYFADRARERSNFLPASLYARLQDGSMGWTMVQRFTVAPLLGRPLPYLPYVNPRVQLFERGGAATTVHPRGAAASGTRRAI